MKKILLISGVVIASTTTFAHASQSAYASLNNGINSPGKNVIASVHHDFPMVKQVTWTRQGKIQIAQFTMVDRKIRAMYARSGRLLSTFITEPPRYIPFEVQTELERKYEGFMPQTVTEYISPDEHSYYVLLKNQQGNRIKWLRVRSDEDGNTLKIVQELRQNIH